MNYTNNCKLCKYVQQFFFFFKSNYVAVYNISKCLLIVYLWVRTVFGLKIVGFPVRIDDKLYARNAFYFNLCFVFDAWARTVQYEPVVKKLTDHLVSIYKY